MFNQNEENVQIIYGNVKNALVLWVTCPFNNTVIMEQICISKNIT